MGARNSFYGRHHTKETKRKLGEKLGGEKNPFFGKHHTEEAKEKDRQKHLGKTTWNKGKPFSVETRKKMSLAQKGRVSRNKGKILPRGWHHTEETRRKISEAHLRIKGGVTPIMRLIRSSFKYHQWRQEVFMRDDFTCQKCNKKGGDISAHHIKPFTKLVEEVKRNLPLLDLYEGAMLYTPLWDVDNGQTLCEKCHKKTYSKG